MKKLLTYITFLFFFIPCLDAQTISGYIYNSLTNEPVYNASVYLEGTSVHTVSGTNGYFRLSPRRRIQTNLVVSHVGFEKMIVETPYEVNRDSIRLKEKNNLLKEVVVNAKKGKYSREERMRAFRNQFLGMTRAGRSCVILNEEDIVVLYSGKDRVLSAYCDVPIQIENIYLGYSIQYDLKLFKVEYTNGTLQDRRMKTFSLLGTSIYTDTGKGNPAIMRNRKEVYLGSRPHFFRSLVNNSLKENKFSFYTNDLTRGVANVFGIEEEGGTLLKKVTLLHSVPIKQIEINKENKQVYLRSAVSYRGRKSEIIFTTTQFVVDYYGNCAPVEDIFFSGLLAEKRVGDMLPLDYEPD